MTSACVSVSRASTRATPLNWVQVFGVQVLISYETPVAFHDRYEHHRRHNVWGPTTGRHLKEAGATNWPECDEDEFNTKLNLAIYKSMTERFALKLEGEKV